MRHTKRILSSVVILSMIIVSFMTFSTGRVIADGVNPGIEAFVRSLYSDCLGRDADPSGLNDWCTQLANGTVTGKQCAYGFFFSSEFILLLENSILVIFYYAFYYSCCQERDFLYFVTDNDMIFM